MRIARSSTWCGRGFLIVAAILGSVDDAYVSVPEAEAVSDGGDPIIVGGEGHMGKGMNPLPGGGYGTPYTKPPKKAVKKAKGK